jgi:hypothetical protein
MDENCLTGCFLFGNLQNNFGPQKVQINLGLEAVRWKTIAKVGMASSSNSYDV